MNLPPVVPTSTEAAQTTNGQESQPQLPAPAPGTNGESPAPLPGVSVPKRRNRLLRFAWGALGALLLLGLMAGGGAAGWWGGKIKRLITGGADHPDLILHKVRHERILITITERGSLESAENREVV